MARLSERLWDGSRKAAESCLQHPFVRGLSDGTLPQERYAKFIAQDAFFLDVFARAYAAGVARAPDRDGMRTFHELQSGVFEELKLHAAASEKLGIDLTVVVPLEAARGYTDFLLANAFAGTLGELVAAMTPCMRLYHFLGLCLAQEGHAAHAYTSWTETYSGAEFGDLVGRLEGLLDSYGQGTPKERDRYERAMEWEFRFFDEAWR